MDDLNSAELRLYMENPYLTRIDTAQKPRELEIVMSKRHNVDFKIFEPPYAGIYVELKGHLRDSQYFPMLKHFPRWLRERYKVVLVNKSASKRAQYRGTLEGMGFECSDFEIPPRWVEQALGLWLDNKEKHFDTELKTSLSKNVYSRDSTYWEVNEHGISLPRIS